MTDSTLIATSTEREQALHRVLGPWAEEHARRYPDIEVLDYDPSVYPDQRIDTFKSLTVHEQLNLPFEQLGEQMFAGFVGALGSGAAEAVAALRDPAKPGGWSLGKRVKEMLLEGKSVALLTAHAERLEDVGTWCGALALALEDTSLIKRNATIVGKVMTREALRGVPIARLFDYFGNVYWVIPDSESAKRWGISDEITNVVNTNAMRMLVSDMRDGIALTFAPAGTAMAQELDADGEVKSLTIPSVTGATVALLSRFDAFVVATMWDGRVALSGLAELPRSSGQTREARRAFQAAIVSEAMATMAGLTEELAGVPVRYRPVEAD